LAALEESEQVDKSYSIFSSSS